MAFTTVAFSESQDAGGAFAKVAAVSDQHIKTSGDKITISDMDYIVGAYACAGTTGEEVRIVSPSLRRTNPYYITPIDLVLTPPVEPAMMFHPDSPIPLTKNEALEAEIKADPAAAEQQSVVVFLSDGVITPFNGNIMTINANITLALVAGSWEFSEITLPDALPAGMYSIVGARVVAADAVAFRFVPVGAANRPGGICASAANARDAYSQRFGRMGSWLEFDQTQPPGIEVLSSAAAASATYECYLDIVAL